MSTYNPTLSEQMASEVIASLPHQYPAITRQPQMASVLEDCRRYLLNLGREGADAPPGTPATAPATTCPPIPVLQALAELTGDPGAPMTLIGLFLSLCEERSQRTTPAAVRARTLNDIVAATRTLVADARTRAEDASRRDRSTGLLNRDGIFERLTTLLATGMSEQRLGVLCIEIRPGIEGLTRLGNPVLETLMREMAGRLRGNVRKRDADNLGRSGPLQFFALLPGLPAEPVANIAAHNLLEALKLPVTVDQLLIQPNPVIGLSTAPSLGRSAQVLLDQAELALEEAKRIHADNTLVFEPRLAQTAVEQAEMVAALAADIHDNELKLYFQPQLNLRTGRIESAEALLRWEVVRPDGTVEVRRPDITLMTTALMGQLDHLSEMLLRQAAMRMNSWQKEAGLTMGLAVNLPANLLKEDLPQIVRGIVGTLDVPPSQLTVEITEGSMIRFGDDMAAAQSVLQGLRDAGIKLAIDDFGTGYGSLVWLRNLPFDELKIDQMFVREMRSRPKDILFVKNLVNLAHDLHLEVVVEGVEDRETWELIQTTGAAKIQGYALGKPMPEAQFLAFVQDFHARQEGRA